MSQNKSFLLYVIYFRHFVTATKSGPTHFPQSSLGLMEKWTVVEK
jgi:hypothetical protein